MSALLARATMTLATCCMDPRRAEWIAAMRAEFEVAVEHGGALRFAVGCLAAALRALMTTQQGWSTLTSYALALGVMLPMATVQIGCALFGFPYLYPGHDGLAGALLLGDGDDTLVRSIYQGAVPSLALLLLVLGIGHLRLAWAMLERDVASVRRLGTWALATTATLLLLMAILFLNGGQALLQALVLAIELASVALVVRSHREPTDTAEHPA